MSQITHTYTGQKLSHKDKWFAKAVRIDPTITTIRKQAFAYCDNLTTVDIHDNVTSIKDYAFFQCKSLKSIAIPSSVQTIGEQAFMHCNNLESVHISASTNSHRTMGILQLP